MRRLLLRALCESIAKGERPAVYGELDRSIYPAGYEEIYIIGGFADSSPLHHESILGCILFAVRQYHSLQN